MTQPDTLTRLWTAARAMFARLRAAVGEAAAIAAREALSVDERIAIRAWLRPLEAMVRKVVLIEAIALARAPAHGPPAPSPARAAGGRRSAGGPNRAAFRLWPRQPVNTGPRIRSLGPIVLVRDIFREQASLARARHMARIRALRTPIQARLAGRIAALDRIIAKPLAHVRRLARKLRVLPKLALKLACKTPPRTKLYDNPEITLASVTAFGEARALFPNTS